MHDLKTYLQPQAISLFKTLCDKCKKIIYRDTDRPDDNMYLYHYTSAEGLKGIIESKALWLTRSDYLNDSTEIDHGVHFFTKSLNEKLSIAKYSKLKDIITISERYFKEAHAQKRLHTYICSFSTNGDSLSQWRSYCPDRGYSIGLHFGQVFSLCPLLPCIYQFEKKESFANKLVETCLDEILSLINGKQLRLEYVAGILTSALVSYVPIFKDKSFASEQEYRLAYLPDFNRSTFILKHRIQKTLFVPYIELPLVPEQSKLSNLHVRISPPNRPHVKKSLDGFLASQNCDKFITFPAKTSYIDDMS